MKRRSFIGLGVGTVGAPILAAADVVSAWAADYPTRPVRIIVGFAAGGGTDMGRIPPCRPIPY